MKKIYLLLMLFGILVSCNQSPKNNEENTDKEQTVEVETEQEYVPEIEMTSDKNKKGDFYIISTSGTADIKQAVMQVKNLKKEGHPAGYLWLPDYESLSDKELYSVFIGPFTGMDTCIKYLTHYKKTKKDAYAVKVQHKKERVVIHSRFDIRINDVKQFLILTYSTPEDENEYAESGGEDWGWFVSEVSDYFSKKYADKVYFGGLYYGWFTRDDIKQLQNEMGLEGFGYILIKGKEKKFIPHDMSDGVISEVCDFFGLEYNLD